MFGLGGGELIIFVIILVLLFGPKKIPELAENIGEAIKHMRGVASVVEDKDKDNKES